MHTIFPRPLKRVLGKIIPFSLYDLIPTFNLGTGTADGTTYLRGDQAWVPFSDILPTASYGLYAQTALGTNITNTIVETSLIGAGVGTLTVPANAFKVGDSFTVKMCGHVSCANNETIHVRLKSNGVVIGDFGIFPMKATTNKVFELMADFTVSKIGGAGVAELLLNGQYSYNHNTQGELDGTNFILASNTTFNTTITNTLTITAQWGSAKNANSIESQNFVLQKVY